MSYPTGFQRAILRAAVRAPSGDNLQPWKFRWENEKLLLLRDVGRDQSLYNVVDLASFIAVGAALENILIAASAGGYQASLVCFPRGPDNPLVASVSFVPGAEPDPLFEAIEKRCSNRKPYSTLPLSSDIVERLAQAAARFFPIEIFWINDHAGRKRLAEIAARGDRTLFENPLIHAHFFSCIRWNEEEVQKTRDGLPLETLELGRLGTKVFRLLKNRALVRLLNAAGFSRMAASRSGGMIRNSAAIGLITVPCVSPEYFFTAGRAFQRVWLTATDQNLALQPMTGFVLLQLRLVLNQIDGLGKNDVRLLESTRPALSELFRVREGVPSIMFRLGVGDPPSARTLRKDILASD